MRRARIAAVWLALLVALCAAGVAAAGTGDVVLVSEHGEIEGEEIAAEVPAISGDGRYVAYVRSVFEHGDSIFLAKPGDGPAVAVDVPEGTAESGLSFDAGAPALSADGRYLVFASEDPNLSKEDKDYDRSAACTCPVRDIFVYDRTTRRVSLVSRRGGPHGAAADDDSNLPSISANGRYVAFGTEAHNLKHGLYGGVWLRDLRNNRMTLVSAAGSAASIRRSRATAKRSPTPSRPGAGRTSIRSASVIQASRAA